MIYVNESTIAAISEYMKEMETGSLYIFISSNLYSLLICIWLESHPHCFTQVGVAGEALQQSSLLLTLGVHGCLPPALGCKAACPAGPGHATRVTPNRLQDFFMFSGYLTSHCFFAFACFVFLPFYPSAPPHTAASGSCPVRSGQNAGNNHTREPFHKIVMRAGKNWARLAASAPCSTHCMPRAAGISSSTAAAAAFPTKGATHALHVCLELCVATEGMCTFPGWFLCLLSLLSLLLSRGINVTGTWEGWHVC